MMCQKTTTWNFTGTNTFSDTNNGGYNLDLWSEVAATANFKSGTTNMNNGLRYVTNNQKVNVASGATLTVGKMQMLNSTSNLTNAGTVNIGGGKLIGTITNTGTINFTNSSSNTTLASNINTSSTKNGFVVVSGGVLDNVTSPKYIYAAQVRVTGGTFKTNLNYVQTHANYCVAEVGKGLLEITGGTASGHDDFRTGYGGALRVVDGGTIRFTGTTTLSGNRDSWNNGTASAGNLGKGGALWTNGAAAVYISNGATVNFTSNSATAANSATGGGGAVYLDNGFFQVDNGGTAKFSGNKAAGVANDIYLSLSTYANLYGTVTMDGGVAGSSNASMTVGDGNTTVKNTVTMTSAAGITGLKALTVNSDGTLNMSGSSGNISATTVTNSGTVKTGTGTYSKTWTNKGVLESAQNVKFTATLTNDTTGTANISAGTFSGAITNKKDFNVSGGVIKGNITNSSTVKATGTNGVQALQSTITNTSKVLLQGTGNLNGSLVISGGSTYVGSSDTSAFTVTGKPENFKGAGTVYIYATNTLTFSTAGTLGSLVRGETIGANTNNGDGTLSINANVEAPASYISAGSNTVAASKVLTLTGKATKDALGKLSKDIVGSGTVDIKGGNVVEAAAYINTNSLHVLSNGTLLVDVDRLGGTLGDAGFINDGLVGLTANGTDEDSAKYPSSTDTLQITLKDGSTGGKVLFDAGSGKTIHTNASKIQTSNNEVVSGTLDLTAGVLGKEIKKGTTAGTVQVSGAVEINAGKITNLNVYTQASKGNLTLTSGTMSGGTLTNNSGGTVNVNGGLISDIIYNSGNINQSNGVITGAITNNSGGSIKVTGGTISTGTLTNNSGGTVHLEGGVIKSPITNKGYIEATTKDGVAALQSTVTNTSTVYLKETGTLNNSAKISGGSLYIGLNTTSADTVTAKAESIAAAVTEIYKTNFLELTTGTLGGKLTGAGTFKVKAGNTVEAYADYLQSDGNIVDSNGELILTEGTVASGGTVRKDITGAGQVTIKSGTSASAKNDIYANAVINTSKLLIKDHGVLYIDADCIGTNLENGLTIEQYGMIGITGDNQNQDKDSYANNTLQVTLKPSGATGGTALFSAGTYVIHADANKIQTTNNFVKSGTLNLTDGTLSQNLQRDSAPTGTPTVQIAPNTGSEKTTVETKANIKDLNVLVNSTGTLIVSDGTVSGGTMTVDSGTVQQTGGIISDVTYNKGTGIIETTGGTYTGRIYNGGTNTAADAGGQATLTIGADGKVGLVTGGITNYADDLVTLTNGTVSTGSVDNWGTFNADKGLISSEVINSDGTHAGAVTTMKSAEISGKTTNKSMGTIMMTQADSIISGENINTGLIVMQDGFISGKSNNMRTSATASGIISIVGTGTICGGITNTGVISVGTAGTGYIGEISGKGVAHPNAALVMGNGGLVNNENELTIHCLTTTGVAATAGTGIINTAAEKTTLVTNAGVKAGDTIMATGSGLLQIENKLGSGTADGDPNLGKDGTLIVGGDPFANGRSVVQVQGDTDIKNITINPLARMYTSTGVDNTAVMGSADKTEITLPVPTTLPNAVILPKDVKLDEGTELTSPLPLPFDYTLSADLTLPNGTTLPAGTKLEEGTILPAGTVLPVALTIKKDTPLPAGTVLPSGIKVEIGLLRQIMGIESVTDLATKLSADQQKALEPLITVLVTKELIGDKSYNNADTFHQTNDTIGTLTMNMGGTMVLNGLETTIGQIVDEKFQGAIVMNQNTLTIRDADSQVGILAVNKVGDNDLNTIYTGAHTLTVGRLATTNLKEELLDQGKEVPTKGFTLQLGDENPLETTGTDDTENQAHITVGKRSTLSGDMRVNVYNNASSLTMAEGVGVTYYEGGLTIKPELTNYGKITLGAPTEGENAGNSIDLQLGEINNASRLSRIAALGNTIIREYDETTEPPVIKNEGEVILKGNVDVTDGIMTNGNESGTYGFTGGTYEPVTDAAGNIISYTLKDATYMTAQTGTKAGTEYAENRIEYTYDINNPTDISNIPYVQVGDGTNPVEVNFTDATLTNYGIFSAKKADVKAVGSTGKSALLDNAAKLSRMEVDGTAEIDGTAIVKNEGIIKLKNVKVVNGELSNGNGTYTYALPSDKLRYGGGAYDKTETIINYERLEDGYNIPRVIVEENATVKGGSLNNFGIFEVQSAIIENGRLNHRGAIMKVNGNITMTGGQVDIGLPQEIFGDDQQKLMTTMVGMMNNGEWPDALMNHETDAEGNPVTTPITDSAQILAYIQANVELFRGALLAAGVPDKALRQGFSDEGAYLSGVTELMGALQKVQEYIKQKNGNNSDGTYSSKVKAEIEGMMTLGDAEEDIGDVGTINIYEDAEVKLNGGAKIYDGTFANKGKVEAKTGTVIDIEGGKIENYDNAAITKVWHGADYMLTGITASPVTPYNPANPALAIYGVSGGPTDPQGYYVTGGTKADGTVVSAVQNFTAAQNQSVNNPLLSLSTKSGIVNYQVKNADGSYTLVALDGSKLLAKLATGIPDLGIPGMTLEDLAGLSNDQKAAIVEKLTPLMGSFAVGTVGGYTPNMDTRTVVLKGGEFVNDGVLRVDNIQMEGTIERTRVVNNGIMSVGPSLIKGGKMDSTGTVVLDGPLTVTGGELDFSKGAVAFTANALLGGGLTISGRDTKLTINISSLMSDELLRIIDADHVAYIHVNEDGTEERAQIYEYVTNIGDQKIYRYDTLKGSGEEMKGSLVGKEADGSPIYKTDGKDDSELAVGQTGWRKLGFVQDVMASTINAYSGLLKGSTKDNAATLYISFKNIGDQMAYDKYEKNADGSYTQIGSNDKYSKATIKIDGVDTDVVIRDDYDYEGGKYYYNFTALRTIQNALFSSVTDYATVRLIDAYPKLGDNELLVLRNQMNEADAYKTKDLDVENSKAIVLEAWKEEDASDKRANNGTAHSYVRANDAGGLPVYTEDNQDGIIAAIAIEGDDLTGIEFGEKNGTTGGNLEATNLAVHNPNFSDFTINVNNGKLGIFGEDGTADKGLLIALDAYTQTSLKRGERLTPNINIETEGDFALGFSAASGKQGGYMKTVNIKHMTKEDVTDDGNVSTKVTGGRLTVSGSGSNLTYETDGKNYYSTHFSIDTLNNGGYVGISDAQLDVKTLNQKLEDRITVADQQIVISGRGKLVTNTMKALSGSVFVDTNATITQNGRIGDNGLYFGKEDGTDGVTVDNGGNISADLITVDNSKLNNSGTVRVSAGGNLTVVGDNAAVDNHNLIALDMMANNDAVMQVNGGNVNNSGRVTGNRINMAAGIWNNTGTGIIAKSIVNNNPVANMDNIVMTGGKFDNSGTVLVKELAIGKEEGNDTAVFNNYATGVLGWLSMPVNKIILGQKGILNNAGQIDPANPDVMQPGGTMYVNYIESSGQIINNGQLEKDNSEGMAGSTTMHLVAGSFVNGTNGIINAGAVTGEDAVEMLVNKGRFTEYGTLTLGINGMTSSGSVRLNGDNNVIRGKYQQTDGQTLVGASDNPNKNLKVNILENLKGDIYNYGKIEIVKADTDSPSFVVVNDGGTDNASVTNGSMVISNASATGPLTLKSASSEMYIDRTATVDFARLKLSGGVIDNDGTLKATAGDVGTEVMNSGHVELRDVGGYSTRSNTSGTLSNKINGGEIKLIRTDDGTQATVVTCGTNLVNNTLIDLNDNILKISCCDLTVAIGSAEKDTGKLEIAGTTTAEKDIYTEVLIDGKDGDETTGDLTVTAEHLYKDVENNGTLHLGGRKKIDFNIVNGQDDKGKLEITGIIESTGEIKQNELEIEQNAKLTVDVGKVTIKKDSVVNNGMLTLMGEGDFVHGIEGTDGKFIVDGKITASTVPLGAAKIYNDIVINPDKELIINAENIDGDSVVTNNGTIDFERNGSLSAIVIGQGNIIVGGDGSTLTVSKDNAIGSGQSVRVESGNVFATDGNVHRLDKLTLASNATLDMQNDNDDGNCKIETLTLNSFIGPTGTGSTAKLKFDVLFTGKTTAVNDKIVLNGTGTGKMDIPNHVDASMGIRVNETLGQEIPQVGDKTSVTLISGNVSGMKLSKEVTSYLGAYKYVFTQRENTGIYDVIKDYGKTLKEVVNNIDDSGSSFYGLTEDYFAHKDEGYADSMGILSVPDGDFTIDGNGHNYMGGPDGETGHQTGIVVGEGYTLTIEDMAVIDRWQDYAVSNNGEFNIENVGQLKADVVNNGTLNIEKLGVLNGKIKNDDEGKGETNVNSDLEIGNNGGIAQNIVNISDGSKLIINTEDTDGNPVLDITEKIAGAGILEVRKNIGIEAEKLQMAGGVVNDAVLALRGEETDSPLAVKISGKGTTQVAGYVISSPDKLGQKVDITGTLKLNGSGVLENEIKGGGTLSIEGGDSAVVDIIANKNISVGEVNLNYGNLTMASGRTLTAGDINMYNASQLTLDRTNVLSSDYKVLDDENISALIGSINMEGNSVVAIRLGDEEVYHASDLMRLNKGRDEGGIGEKTIFIGGKMLIDDTIEDLVVYGEVNNGNVVMKEMRPTVVAGVESDDPKAKITPVGDQLAKTIKVVNDCDIDYVDSLTPEVVTNIQFIDNSQVGAKNLQISADASNREVTVVVGGDNTNNRVTLVGTKDGGVVVDEKNKAVPTNVKVESNGLFELGDRNAQVLGNSGTLQEVVSDGNVNVYNTIVTIKSFTGEGLWVDPGIVSITDSLSFNGDDPVGAQTDGSVLKYKMDDDTLREALAVANIDYSPTEGVRDGLGVLALGEQVMLTGTHKLGVAARASDITTSGLILQKGSVLVVKSSNGGPAVVDVGSSDGKPCVEVAPDGKLVVVSDDFAEGNKYTIVHSNVQIGNAKENILWNEENIYASDAIYRLVYDTQNADFSNYVLRAEYNTVEAVYGAGNIAASGIFDKMLREKGTEANKWLKSVLNLRGSSGGREKGVGMLNAAANIGETAGVMHGLATIVQTFGKNMYSRLGITERPSLLRTIDREPALRLQNTVYDLGDAPQIRDFITDKEVETVAVGKQEEIMPVHEVRDFKFKNYDSMEKEVWASYVNSKEKVDGLKFVGIKAKYDLNVKGATVGADLWSKEDSIGGLAVMYADGDANGSSGGVSTRNDVDYYGVGLYERKDIADDTILLMDVNYTHGKNDIKQDNNGVEIIAKPKVDTFSAGIQVEKMFGTENKQFTPYAGARYLHMESKSYENNLDMKYGSKKAEIVSIPVGFKAGAFKETYGGWHFGPFVEAGYIFNIGDVKDKMKVAYGGVAENFKYEIMDDGCLFTNAGFVVRKDGFIIQLGYTYMKGRKSKNNRYNVNMNFEF
ncbi:MAG: hypothetical protein KBS60_03160 [Phascolarctobacterium sp.]|nr:hypothetical protein [Candidatus Phascolarctobacterium caballi]